MHFNSLSFLAFSCSLLLLLILARRHGRVREAGENWRGNLWKGGCSIEEGEGTALLLSSFFLLSSASASWASRECLFFCSRPQLTHSPPLSLLLSSFHLFQPHAHALQVYKAKEKSTGRLVALKKTRLEVRKRARSFCFFDHRASTALCCCCLLFSAATRLIAKTTVAEELRDGSSALSLSQFERRRTFFSRS